MVSAVAGAAARPSKQASRRGARLEQLLRAGGAGPPGRGTRHPARLQLQLPHVRRVEAVLVRRLALQLAVSFLEQRALSPQRVA